MAKDEGFMSGSGTSDDMGSFAQGGRIGLRLGGDPEEPSENIFEFMQDQGIPGGEMVSADEGVPFMWEEFLDAVKNHGYKGTYDQFLNDIDRSPWDEAAVEDQGIARLL